MELADRGFGNVSLAPFPEAGASLPLLVTPSGPGALPDFARSSRALVDEELAKSGAILFRGFPVRSPGDFDRFVKLITPELVEYEFGSTPRSRVSGRIYTSTEYPAHQQIPLHNEQSYTTEWPLKIWFYCARPALEGGRTPLCDSREVWRRIPPAIRERFAVRQVMYTRNYGNGLDVPWQKVFGTDDRAQVERFCRSAGIACEWKADGELRTRQVCQAVAAHPRTKDMVWFNQAHLFHVSNLEPAAREGLLAVLAEDELPRNAFYGDGASIEESVLDEIREVYRQVTVAFDWREGDLVLADNMLVAHGRTSFKGPRQVLVAMAEPYRPGAAAGANEGMTS
jgi:alpha-ketoglutarate-dependent taurine dioxygenase